MQEEFQLYNMDKIKIKLKVNLPDGKVGDVLVVKKDSKYISYWLKRIQDGDVELFVENNKNRAPIKEEVEKVNQSKN